MTLPKKDNLMKFGNGLRNRDRSWHIERRMGLRLTRINMKNHSYFPIEVKVRTPRKEKTVKIVMIILAGSAQAVNQHAKRSLFEEIQASLLQIEVICHLTICKKLGQNHLAAVLKKLRT